tara:strand:- start:1034 stop:1306 length:273 start_codon:yes stop_codon:yes gene_type:complete
MALSLPPIKKTVLKTVKSVQNFFFNIDSYAHDCAVIQELSYRLEDLTGIYWINGANLSYELRLTCGEIIFTTSDRVAFIAELKNQLKEVN